MGIEKKAYAKINLSLDVTGKLDNGYHEVCMVMQTIDICDELSFDVIKNVSSGQRIKIHTGSLITENVEDNLVYKAAVKMLPYISGDVGVEIKLVKNIPMAAGMAGGSSDAAAVLRGMNELFELGLSDEELCRIGVTIGADVPYCIMGGTMLAEGIGEKLTVLDSAAGIDLVIAKPMEGVSTAYVYKTLDAIDDPPHPDVGSMIAAIKAYAGVKATEADIAASRTVASEKSDPEKISGCLGNILESVTIPACPKVGEIKDILMENGALGALMSGSGPTVFGIFENREKAEKAAEALRNMKDCPAVDIFVTKTI